MEHVAKGNKHKLKPSRETQGSLEAAGVQGHWFLYDVRPMVCDGLKNS